jgi:chromosome segregation ATPase
MLASYKHACYKHLCLNIFGAACNVYFLTCTFVSDLILSAIFLFQVGLQKLVEDHKVKLESERRNFELELESEKKSFDEKMKHREADLVQKEKELRSREDKISKSEQALDGRKKKLAELQNDLDTKSKALKKWDESLKTEDKKLAEEKLQLERERKQAEMYISDIESLKATIEAEKKKILEEQNNLKITEEERQEHSLLTEQLKKEIDEYRMRSNSLSEETEDLRKQRQKFEEEWEQLDEKRARLEEEAKNLKNEKTHLERWRDSEEKRFKDAQDEMEAKYRERQENLALKEKALLDDVKHQREEIDEVLKKERADLERNLQLHRHELEMEMENRLAKKEKELEEKENELNKKRDFIEDQLKHAIDLNESKIQKIILEKQQFQRERDVLVEEKRKLETDKADIRKDIDSLNELSKSLKARREAYITERDNLIAMFEKYKVCKSCGVSIFEGFGDLDNADIDIPSLAVEGDDRSPNTDTLAEDTGMRVNSAGGFSLLQKCSRLFKFSPRKKAEQSTEQEEERNIPFGERLEEASPSEDYEPTPVYQVANNSFEAEDLPADTGARGNEESERLDIAEDVQMEPSAGFADNEAQSFGGANDMAVDTTITSVDQNGND